MDKVTKSEKIGDIAQKYEDSFQFLQARKKRQAQQLKLLVNLQKGDQTIASTLLLTLFNRVMSSSYDDKLQIKFLPSQGINQDQINAYNMLAQSDYLEMGKAKLDYDWCWDTLFYGRGYMETYNFDKKRKIMTPHVINPLVFGYDPIVAEVEGWRYYWKWITKNKWEIQKLIDSGKITGIKKPEEIASGVDPYLWEYKVIVDQARYGIAPSPEPYSVDVFQILEFYTYNDKGNKCCYWLDKNFSTIIMEEELELEDEDDGGSKWPIVIKESYRQPHSSIPFSVADLLDDKHRAKSVLLNLAFIAAKDRANPVYLYNSDKVDDVTQFLSRQVNQHIPVSDIEGAVAPLNTEDPMSAGLIQFISMLTQEANEPLGVGQVMQPMSAKGDKTATADAINQQMNDMATSLLSKVMQFGESEFWSHWFHRYAQHSEDLGSKMANIVGVKGIDTKEIDLSIFNTKFPPGIMVYSAKEAEYKNLVKRRDMMQLYPDLLNSMDKDGLRNFQKHVFFPLILDDPSLIDIMFPKTLDEIKAEGENEQLAKNEMPQVLPTDEDTTHIYTHMMVQPRTWALWTHIEWHQEQLAQKKSQAEQQAGASSDGQSKVSESIGFKDLPPAGQVQMAAQAGIQLSPNDMVAMPQQGAGPPKPGGAAKPGAGPAKRSPMSAASPLKSEINTQPVVR